MAVRVCRHSGCSRVGTACGPARGRVLEGNLAWRLDGHCQAEGHNVVPLQCHSWHALLCAQCCSLCCQGSCRALLTQSVSNALQGTGKHRGGHLGYLAQQQISSKAVKSTALSLAQPLSQLVLLQHTPLHSQHSNCGRSCDKHPTLACQHAMWPSCLDA